MKTTRREFLKRVALTGAAISGLPAAATAAQKAMAGGKSRVVIATDRAVLADGAVVESVLDRMLAQSIVKLTGAEDAAAGWGALFSPDDVVGIKVNCLFGKGVSTRPEVVMGIVRGLKQAGVRESNIIIWDRSTGDLIKSGFTPNKGNNGVLCLADDGDWGETIEQGTFKGRITKMISERVTAYVNAPVLKTHGIAGISCCLKNHYGSFDNPGNHHSNHCNPAMADFSAIPLVKKKCRLVVADALRPQYDGGPGLKADAQFDYYSLILSTDPVAADAEGLKVIQARRKELNMDALPAEKTAWLRSAQERGVGVCDPEKIELVRV